MYETDPKHGVHSEDSINATFRVNASVMKKLRAESEKRQTSLNAYINQVLLQHVEWDLFESRIGMMPFPKPVLANIFASLSTEEIKMLATGIGKNTAIEMSIFVQGRFNVETFISWIETRMKNSGCEVVYHTGGDDGARKTIVIKHDLGKNWSLYMKTMIESALEEVLGKVSNSFISDSLVSLEYKI
ncbi:hypothetical protein [Candidatus Nitrososphaera evergladensis]|nr:hypothetical protein [Candidatus Nitrososphaera evergladensis]